MIAQTLLILLELTGEVKAATEILPADLQAVGAGLKSFCLHKCREHLARSRANNRREYSVDGVQVAVGQKVKLTEVAK